MLKERHTKLIELVSQRGKIEVSELAVLLETSRVTVRKDLDHLEQKGILARERGYALLRDEGDINYRMAFHYEQKQRIAAAAARLVQDRETVMIESGSCCMLLAEQLAQSKKEVTLVTNSAFMASYVKGSSVRVVVLGGDYQPQVQAMVGPLTKLCAQQFQVDKLFVGTDGYSFENGFTGDNLVRSDTVKAMAQSARHTIVLTESEKFTRSGTVSFLKTEQVSGVITDTGIPGEVRAFLEQAGLDVRAV